MLRVKASGSFTKTETFLKSIGRDYTDTLKRYGQRGVDLLSAATPIDSGKTANAWSYQIVNTKEGQKLEWHNSNVAEYVPVVILLVYGHGCQNGSYVDGFNFINPALEPLFKSMAEELLKEVN